MDIDLHSLEQNLRSSIRGQVSFDAVTCGLYATDSSIYQIQPVGVVVPQDEADVLAAMRVAALHRVPVIPRGAGTSLGGQVVWQGLVIDFSRHFNNILELNTDQRWVRVQPGVVRDELNRYLKEHGLHFAADPATGNRANIGGMIGNNSSGMRSIMYGKTVDHVLAVRVLLADGTILTLGELDEPEYQRRMAGQTREAEILRTVREIVTDNRDEIIARYPKVMRRVSGYNLDEFVHTDRWNLAKLIAGSEGTLGVILDATLNLEPLPSQSIMCVAHFDDVIKALDAVKTIIQHNPSAVEIMDRTVMRFGRDSISPDHAAEFLIGDPAAVLVIEFAGDNADELAGRVQTLIEDIRSRGMGTDYPVLAGSASQKRVWQMRKDGLGLMTRVEGARKPVAFIEDCCVPVDVLGEYADDIVAMLKRYDVEAGIYAHASVGVVHVRPMLDLRNQNDIDLLKPIADETFDLVKKYEGSFSSEHGDGIVRSGYIRAFFGDRLFDAFGQIKRLFDPAGLMNPGKIVEAVPIEQNLRYGVSYRAEPFQPWFHYRKDGGFTAAVEMCTGVGACRKTGEGTMCPSYMGTRDEMHSTRGRANALRLAMTGQLGPDSLSDRRLFEVLDLCLSCKSCKTECPSNVDMAKLKVEFLQHHHDRYGPTLRDRMVAGSDTMARMCSGLWAPLVNAVMGTPPAKYALEKLAGFDRRRTPPAYVSQPLHRWFAKRPKPSGTTHRQVVLFDDVYMNYHETAVGKAAVELLESCGYGVILARAGSAQRPRISHGFLRDAKRDGQQTLRNLDRYVGQGLDIVVCEPSDCSALTDDLVDLIDDEDLGRRVAEHTMMIDVFLARELQAGRLGCSFTSPLTSILLHGHCHQEALFGTLAMTAIWDTIDSLEYRTVDSGCCGMAGSFGYEAEHYDLSQTIGNQRLFPAILARGADTAVVACGFSCRHQIYDATGVYPLHWVQTVRGTAAAG